MQEIIVSIICNTYNHEKYIGKALNSFVSQKTNFSFEILIHDDASTDNTPQIIREFEKKYPELIKPVYQNVNQYSLGGFERVSIGIQWKRSKGKYIAVCEGDDYWTDPYKLQKQYDAMEQHPEVDMCCHSAAVVHAEDEHVLHYLRPRTSTAILPVQEMISEGGGYVATNSLFYRRELNACIPEFRQAYYLDYALQIHGALRGGVLYLDDCMSAYRSMATGSWTSKNYADQAKMIAHNEKLCAMLGILDQETCGIYHDTIQQVINRKQLSNKLYLDKEKNKSKLLLQQEYSELYNSYPCKERFKIWVKAYFPWIATLKRYITRS